MRDLEVTKKETDYCLMCRVAKLLRQQLLPSHWPTGQSSTGSVGADERFDALEEANDTLIERVVRGILSVCKKTPLSHRVCCWMRQQV